MFRTGEPAGSRDSGQDLMLLFDARHVGIAYRADYVAVLPNAEDVGQSEILAALIALVVQARFEGGQQRSAAVHVRAQSPALLVTQQRGIGQNQRTVLRQIGWRQFILVHKIEQESAFQ